MQALHRIVFNRPRLFAHCAALAIATLSASTFAQNDNSLAGLVPNIKAGAELYDSVCKGCHGVSIAPTLRGVVNRPIASVESFAGYSEGLKAKRPLTWTKENLSAFLTAPNDFAPGTLMVQVIPEAQTRADIIGFLEKLPPPR